jgi:4-amino-4-deoxy-L-arabinose transferase-like glycosyltransferase
MPRYSPPRTSAAWPWSSRGAAISGINRRVLLGILVAGAVVYFVSLGNSAIWDANEAYYVETPREMLEAHDLVNPSFNYEPRFNKPVLSYWIVAGLYRMFGVSVGVERFGIATGAMLIVLAAYLLAGAVAFGDAETRRPSAAAWAAAGLLASPRLLMFARRIFIDIWLTAFMSLTLAFFALSEAHPERRRRYLLLMYAAVGLGTLTKGPVAIALPGLAFAVYLAIRRELGRVREMMIPAGIVIVAAIVLPWYAMLYHLHGWTYIKSFLVTENIERYSEGVGVRLRRGPFFYLPVVFSDSFPWSMLLPMAAVAAWRTPSKLQTLLWCWIVIIVGFFSCSAGKQDLYIFPIVAAVAALGGTAIARTLAADGDRGWLLLTMGISGALLGVAGAGVLYLFAGAARVYALQAALMVGLLALAGGIGVVVLTVLRRPAAAALTLLSVMIAVNWTFVVRVLPEFERYKPVPGFSETLKARLQPGDAVVHYQASLPSMTYYLRRHVDTTFDPDSFIKAIRVPNRVYAVLSDDDYAALKDRLGPTCVIDRRPTFDVKLARVLAREPLPELLLISNQCR